MYNNQLCTCDTSDTEGSDIGCGDLEIGQDCGCNGVNGNQGGEFPTADPNFQMNYGSQQFNRSNQMSGPVQVSSCACSGKHSSSQTQGSQQRSGSKASQQRTSFNVNATSVPAEYRMSAGAQNGFLPMDFQGMQQYQHCGSQPMGVPLQMEPRRPSQTNGGGQPRGSATNPRTSQLGYSSQQQNGKSCTALVCQGGPPGGNQGQRRSLQANNGLETVDANQFAQAQQQQIISPCCMPTILKKTPSPPPPPPPPTMPNSGEEECTCNPPPLPPNEGSRLCFCSDNPGPPESEETACEWPTPPSGTEACPSCAEFEPQPEPPESPCPPDNVEGEEPNAPCTCTEEPPNEEPANEEEPPNEVLGKHSESNELTDKSDKKGGFCQQVQFQLYQQCDGNGNGHDSNNNKVDTDEAKVDENKNGIGEDVNGADCCAESAANNSAKECENGNGPENINVAEAAVTNGGETSNGTKSSGKQWQQITLDIYQSQGGQSSSQQGGWQQQFRLMIYQEKLDNGNGAVTTTFSNGNGNGNGNETGPAEEPQANETVNSTC